MLNRALPLEGEGAIASSSGMQGQAKALAGRSLFSGTHKTLKVGLTDREA
jgi:hypothetical protein